MGTHLAIRVYNMFILPALLFVAQLQTPTDEAFRAEKKVAAKIATGRASWCKTTGLAHMKNPGAPVELRDLKINAEAAMARTAMWENTTNGGIRWKTLTREFQQAQNEMKYIARNAHRSDWREKHIPTTMYNHIQHMEKDHNLNQATIRISLTKNAELPLPMEIHNQWRKNTQKRIHQKLRESSNYNQEEEIRKKLKPRSLQGHQRILAGRRKKNTGRIFQLTAPRIGFARWSTIMRRWPTAKAFQKGKHSHCLLGCGQGKDDTDHYVFL